MGRKARISLSDSDLVRAALASKAYRLYHQLTQMRFAIELNCQCADINRIENEKGKRPSLIVAAILALPVPPKPETTTDR